MEKNNIQHNREQTVLERIEQEHIHMKPRLYFTIKIIAYSIIFILACILLLSIVSFMVFIVEYYGFFDLPAFGMEGISSFIASFPWVLFAITLVLIFIAQRLMRRFEFAYRKPVSYLLIGIGVLSLGGGMLLMSSTELPHIFFDSDEYPGLSSEFIPLHSGFMPQGFITGTIVSMQKGSLLVKESDGSIVRIALTAQTRYLGSEDLVPGDRILARSTHPRNSQTSAFIIRKISGVVAYPTLLPQQVITTSTLSTP